MVSPMLKQQGDVDAMENISMSPATSENKSVAQAGFPLCPTPDLKKPKAMSVLSVTGLATELPHPFIYLSELGWNIKKLEAFVRRHPYFANYSLDKNIKPLVEFLLDLGMSRSHISIILHKFPQLCKLNISLQLIPAMNFLESLGVDNKQWARVIYHHPALVTYSRQKLKENVDFLYEMGISPNNVGKILTRWSTIIGYSVEYKLRPTADFFRSLGVDVALLLRRYPQNFGFSIDTKLIPVTNFFLERGYSIEEVGVMISRFGGLCKYSLAKSIIPKWEFFLTMDYSRDDLVTCPHYFGYSLEGRIKPRYACIKKCGVQLPLSSMLATSEHDFEMALERKIKKMSSKTSPSVKQGSDDQPFVVEK